ncbi:helix-turn-helix domain-containing protein [Candidatus Omnitrophota bacterium]
MDKRFIGVRELSNYLTITVGTLYVWVSQRRIPFVKINGATRFDLKEIDAWLKDKRVKEFS